MVQKKPEQEEMGIIIQSEPWNDNSEATERYQAQKTQMSYITGKNPSPEIWGALVVAADPHWNKST